MSKEQLPMVIEGTFIFLSPDGMNNYAPLLIKLSLKLTSSPSQPAETPSDCLNASPHRRLFGIHVLSLSNNKKHI